LKKTSFFSSDLQRKIKKALSRFWQERFISLKDDDSPTAKDFLLKNPFFLNSDHFVESDPFPPTNPALLSKALELAGFPEQILSQKLISLSNGELRRLMLARNYMEEPDLWILEDPYGGMDPAYRKFLAGRIDLFRGMGIDMRVNLGGRGDGACRGKARLALPPSLPTPGEVLFSLKNLCVSFGSKKVIENLNWEVRKGEHWAITGPNGSGKSTLLGVLSGDHPQIYRNDLVLLGQNVKNRFSVSEHKDKLGLFSPEMALQTPGETTALGVLLENFLQPVLAEEKRLATALLTHLGLGGELNKLLKDLSEEHFKLVLIARAISKNPQALILDEPTQTMSTPSREKLFSLLDKIAEKTTLIFTTHYPGEWPACVTNVLGL